MKRGPILFISVGMGIATLAFLATPAPACACIETSPAAKYWVACSVSVAKKNGEANFYENYLVARRDNKKLLPATPARFSKLEEKIVKTCGTYQQARRKDLDAGWASYHVPADFIEARWH
ncbi:hypothetical protein GGC65_000276 [Sphingopyxis sp. OAS728]|uniref:hypothetical protein n=1 Tax=Sphingopyxis sp. OAS728 TaxID=2663823 RepID=UPI0017893F2B|nr:hypothetical protein [Sphingopyxis sp. OAS728]MBE1525820.1 hypothetical protein [Sphingopyxis sp. OAS728]